VDRSGATALNGATVAGILYAFTTPASQPTNANPTGITQVNFWLDNPAMTGTPLKTENTVPYDFNSTGWDTRAVANGGHTITQQVKRSNGTTEVDTAGFTVQNPPQSTLFASPTTIPDGGSSTLTWTTTNAATATLNGNAVALNGSLVVTPAATTTYTLVATGPGGSANRSVTVNVGGSAAVQRYEYVMVDQNLYVYDLDNFQLVKHVSIPQAKSVHGLGAAPSTHTLYVSYGTQGPNTATNPGSLLAFDLLTDTVLWTKTYSPGIDSFDITPDGKTIYMPDGEANQNGIWWALDAANGNITATINTGWLGPHNTFVTLDGQYVFMGPHLSKALVQVSTATNTVVGSISPTQAPAGPFTLNGKHTLAFTTGTGFFGFQVSDTVTRKVLYTVPVAGFSIPPNPPIGTPSHGISLSPDEKEIYLIDTANAYAHVFDVSGLPAVAPVQVANIPLSDDYFGMTSPCNSPNCDRGGWIRHTLDGRYVLVGNSVDVIETSTRQLIASLPQLYNTRNYIEIDWQNGLPIATSTKYGKGYVK